MTGARPRARPERENSPPKTKPSTTYEQDITLLVDVDVGPLDCTCPGTLHSRGPDVTGGGIRVDLLTLERC